ncbi:MAG TPA: ATP-binding protein [Polyangia bacterium]|nr:ATP-binding protein [Polyangia bacterium]
MSILLVLAIGLAGGTAIYQSARNMRHELTTEYQLFAENRAFALRDNFEILEDELKRLAMSPQVNLGDDNLLPEQQLLSGAHQNSVLYNTAVLLLSADGACLGSVPDRPEFRRQSFGDRPWFQEARAGRQAGKVRPDVPGVPNVPGGPTFHPTFYPTFHTIFRATDEPDIGRTIKIIQPIVREGRFTGALVGMIALGEANLITPALHDNLPRSTDAMLVDENGRIIYPPGRALASSGSDWERAIQLAATGATGTLTGDASGQEALFAYSPVRAATPFAVVFSWPWSALNANLHQQVGTLAGILLFGFLLAAIAGLTLSAYLTRPLHALGESAIRIARGERLPSVRPPFPGRTEEVRALVAAFEHMETAIRQRDDELREAAAMLEHRVRDRTQKLVATQEALVDAERFAAMGKTSAAIAHEIKNTLNGLGMAVELIVEDPGNVNRVARLRPQVAGEIARLRDVVDSLLSFSRSPRVELGSADLVPVIQEARLLLADLTQDRGTTVTVETPPELPLYCDSHKMKGVLVNLIKNAVEASRQVRVSGAVDGGDVVIEVADDGPGLAEEVRKHLFEPFFTTKPNGTGLGLPTSQRYVEAHGGTLEAAPGPSALGGALFRVRLPRVVRGEHAPRPATPAGGATAANERNG